MYPKNYIDSNGQQPNSGRSILWASGKALTLEVGKGRGTMLVGPQLRKALAKWPHALPLGYFRVSSCMEAGAKHVSCSLSYQN